MHSDVNVIEEIYGAFTRGDVAAVLGRMNENARWDFNVARSDVPWHRPATGRAEIEGFLATFVAHVTLTAFEPRRFIGSADEVIVDVRVAYLVKKTGRLVDIQQLHWWSLADGLVTRLRHFEDTAHVIAAWRGSPG